MAAWPGDKREYRRWGRTTDVHYYRRIPLFYTSTSLTDTLRAIGDTRSSHGRRWYNCTWLSADTRRAPAARHLAASFHFSGTFYIRLHQSESSRRLGRSVSSLFVAELLPSFSSCKPFSMSKWKTPFLHDD